MVTAQSQSTSGTNYVTKGWGDEQTSTGCLISRRARADAQPVPAPWRSDDATLHSLCFDGLSKEAPEKITALEITDVSIATKTFEILDEILVGGGGFEPPTPAV